MLALALGGAQATDPPRDPWRDPEWQVEMLELEPAAVQALRFTQALYGDPRSAPGVKPRPFSTRDVRLEFDDRGRLLRLDQTRMQDHGPLRRQRLRYVYGAAGRMERIEDEDGGGLVYAERVDAAGRPVEIAERQGVLLVRTRIDYDKAGREVERVTDDGQGQPARRERRRYRADGTPASVERKGFGLAGSSRTVHFDAQGRPRRVVDHDVFDHAITDIDYPDPLTAIWRKRGVEATRERLGPYRSETTYSVRHADEFLRPDPPEHPAIRIERDARGQREARTEFDASGRPLRLRHYDGEGGLVCVESGASDSDATSSAGSAEPACGGSAAIAVAIERNARGHWTRQVFEARLPDGSRRLLAEKTRSIEYR